MLFGSFGSRRCLHCSSRGKKAGCYFNRYGEEVSLGLEVVQLLAEKGYDIRLVSAPSLERYHALEKEKQEELFPVGIKKFVLEKSSSYSWYEFVHNKNYLFTNDCFGASGTKEQLDEK